MKPQTLLGALPILAKFLGRKLGVNVVVGGDCARTDGKTIFLPALPEHEAAHILAHGYLDHEGAHVRYTAFTEVEPLTPLGKALVNILEDIRIEKALGTALPGSRRNLERLVAYLVQQGDFWQVPNPQAHPVQQVQAYLLFRLRVSLLGQAAMQPLADQAEALLRQTLPAGAMTKLTALAFAVTNAQSTRDVSELAQRMLQMLEEEQRQAEDTCAKQDAEFPNGESQAATESESDSFGNGTQNPLSNPNETPDSAVPNSTMSKATGDNQNPSEVLRQILEADAEHLNPALGDLGRQLEQQLNRSACHQTEVSVMAEFDPVAEAIGSAMLSHRVRATTVALRRRLAGLVQAHRRDDVRRVRQGRQLAYRQLYRLPCRESGIFVKKTRRQSPDTAVYLLLDRSGSMAGARIRVASEATLATALALAEIPGCQAAVLAFPSSTEQRVIPLLGFTEQAKTVAGRFRLVAQGSTPMANALWRAAYELLLRPETRRLLVVITDGEPNHPQATAGVIQRCRRSGIEVFGLGIELDEPVKALFGVPSAVFIEDIQDLPKALFRLLERGLLVA